MLKTVLMKYNNNIILSSVFVIHLLTNTNTRLFCKCFYQRTESRNQRVGDTIRQSGLLSIDNDLLLFNIEFWCLEIIECQRLPVFRHSPNRLIFFIKF